MFFSSPRRFGNHRVMLKNESAILTHENKIWAAETSHAWGKFRPHDSLLAQPYHNQSHIHQMALSRECCILSTAYI